MKTQQHQFAVVTKNNVVQAIGRSVIYQPSIKSNCKGIKWYEDKPKKGGVNHGI